MSTLVHQRLRASTDAMLAAIAVAVMLLVVGFVHPAIAQEPLPSWNDTAAKTLIMEFVKATVTEGGDGYVALADRIAVFDNDGTLWSEQPIYSQLAFALDRVKALAAQHPEWKTKEPYKSVLAGDPMGALKSGEKGLIDLVTTTHAGMTTDQFSKIVSDWFATARHP